MPSGSLNASSYRERFVARGSIGLKGWIGNAARSDAAWNDAFLDRRARGVQGVVSAILEMRPSVIYRSQMTEVRQTPIFRKWLGDLADRRAAEHIAKQIVRLRSGLIGDAKAVGGGVADRSWTGGTGSISPNAERC